MRNGESGFTVVEVLVAIMVMGVGVVAMVGSAGTITRMIGHGKLETRAAQAAARRLETLRLAAYSTTPKCTAAAFASGGPVTSAGITETWVIPVAGNLRDVSVTVSRRTVRGIRAAVLRTRIEC